MNKKIFLTVVIIAMSFLPKAQTWSTLGKGVSADVYGMTVYNGNLYSTGLLRKAGNVKARFIAQWNGTAWDSVGKGLNYYGFSLASYNSDLYAGGGFDSAGGLPAKYIAKWNGSSWSPVGTGMNAFVNSMITYNGNLIVGGQFDSAGGQQANYIAQWNGSGWSPIGAGIKDTGLITEIAALAVYNGELYAGGIFDSAGGVRASNIAKWNGTSWSPVGGGIVGHNYTSYYPGVYCLCVYQGKLYAGGDFDSAGGIQASNIAVWDGTTWSNPGGGLNMPGGALVSSIVNYNDELYAGGIFDRAGIDTANYIAQWNGNKWYPVGSGTNGEVMSLAFYNSSLIAGGQFNMAGSTSCNDIAAWIGGPMPSSEICYITVDTASKFNEILWDKTSVDTALVDSFRIYRKVLSTYTYIGHVSVHDYTHFVDSGSQPNTVSASYEICNVDTSGLVSQLTPHHQTILLQSSLGVGNTVNLSWNAYIGDSVNYYLILRDSTGLGNWQRLDSVSNTTFAYTDNTPPISKNLRYIISTVWNLHCIPYSNAPHQSDKLASVNQATSRSNRKQLVVSALPSMNFNPKINIYPNPSKTELFITLSNPAEVIIELTDVLGQNIFSDKIASNETKKQINLAEIKQGVYFLQLTMKDGSNIVKKIEIIK